MTSNPEVNPSQTAYSNTNYDDSVAIPHTEIVKSRKSKYIYAKIHVGTLGTWGTVFAIISTIVGGGIVSIPWAFS